MYSSPIYGVGPTGSVRGFGSPSVCAQSKVDGKCSGQVDYFAAEPVTKLSIMSNFVQSVMIKIKIELADAGRPAPAALPGDCCGPSSSTRPLDGPTRLRTDRFE